MSPRRAALILIAAAVAMTALPDAAPAAKKKFKFGSRTLQVGAKGKDVRFLQRSLNTLSITTAVNGVFRPKTRKAVKKLEKRQRWKVNGVVSRKDAKKIKKLVAQRRASVYFLYGGYYPTVSIRAQAEGTATLEVVNAANSALVDTIPVSFTAAGERGFIWDLRAASGAWAGDATYQFRLSEPGTARAAIAGGQTKPFLVRAYAFPVRGKHNFGGAGARFGAGRGDHSHQGQDVIAGCGTPLVAAQGGTVTTKAYQAGGAGNYLVIHSAVTGTDTVYMHLKKPSPLLRGQAVYTGTQIGKVGTTGSSTGCHLHFEHWTAPGWYRGGAPYDPLPELTYWDAYS